MKSLYKALFLLSSFLALILFPIKESVIFHSISVNLLHETEENQVFELSANYPFEYNLYTNNTKLMITIPDVNTLDIHENVKLKNLCDFEGRIDKKHDLLLSFQLKQFPFFYSNQYKQIYKMVVEITKRSGTSLTNKVIVLDPGHGAYSDDPELWDYYDCGAISISGIYESVINLDIAKKVKSLLERENATVVLTRENEKDRNSLRFEQRGFMVNDLLPDAYISIHQNTATESNIRGCIGYFSNPTAEKLIREITNNINHEAGIPIRKLIDGKFEMIEKMRLDAKVLIECCFLSNPIDESIVKQETGREKIAYGIANGILNFFENQ